MCNLVHASFQSHILRRPSWVSEARTLFRDTGWQTTLQLFDLCWRSNDQWKNSIWTSVVFKSQSKQLHILHHFGWQNVSSVQLWFEGSTFNDSWYRAVGWRIKDVLFKKSSSSGRYVFQILKGLSCDCGRSKLWFWMFGNRHFAESSWIETNPLTSSLRIFSVFIVHTEFVYLKWIEKKPAGHRTGCIRHVPMVSLCHISDVRDEQFVGL